MVLTKLAAHKNKILNTWVLGKSSPSAAAAAPLDPAAPTVFFVHGLGSSQNFYYALLAKHILPHANAVLMDTEGSSQSPLASTTTAPTADSIVDDVYAVLQHYGVSHDVTLVGHSMGGMLVLRAAHDARSRGLITGVVGIGPVHPSPALAEVFSARTRAVAEAGNVLGLADAVSGGAALGSRAQPLHRAFVRTLIAQQSAAGYIAMCNVISETKPVPYGEIEQPVLIICGSEDTSAPYAGCVEVIEKGLKSVRLETLEGVGHWHAIEASDQVGALIASMI